MGDVARDGSDKDALEAMGAGGYRGRKDGRVNQGTGEARNGKGEEDQVAEGVPRQRAALKRRHRRGRRRRVAVYQQEVEWACTVVVDVSLM